MHNDTWLKGGKDYIYALKDFIDKAQDHRQQASSVANNNQTAANARQQMPVQRKPHGNNNMQDFN